MIRVMSLEDWSSHEFSEYHDTTIVLRDVFYHETGRMIESHNPWRSTMLNVISMMLHDLKMHFIRTDKARLRAF
jgi:hypothetical protein